MTDLADALHSILKQKDSSPLFGQASVRLSDVRQHVSELNAAIDRLVDLGCTFDEVIRELRISRAEREEHVSAKKAMFNEVPLPPGLKVEQLAEAMDYSTGLIAAMNRDLRDGVGKPLSSFIQANNFSGIVSNILTDAMHKFTDYKHNHDQRYPDLKTSDGHGLEMKAANKAGKGGESHNAHGGWHMVACFSLDDTGNIRFVQIEVARGAAARKGDAAHFHAPNAGPVSAGGVFACCGVGFCVSTAPWTCSFSCHRRRLLAGARPSDL